MKTTLFFVLAILSLSIAACRPAPAVATPTPESTVTNPSFSGDCKDPSKPYFNLHYSSEGNYGTCDATQEEAPLQVIDGQECPLDTVRQLIHANEGSEAVCLPLDNMEQPAQSIADSLSNEYVEFIKIDSTNDHPANTVFAYVFESDECSYGIFADAKMANGQKLKDGTLYLFSIVGDEGAALSSMKKYCESR